MCNAIMDDKVAKLLNDKTSHKILFKVIGDFHKDLNIQLLTHRNFIDKLECLCNEINIAQCIVSENKLTEAHRIHCEILERYRNHMEKWFESISSLNSCLQKSKLHDAEMVRDVKKHYQEILIQRKILFLAIKQIHTKSILKYKKLIIDQDIKNCEKIKYELQNFYN